MADLQGGMSKAAEEGRMSIGRVAQLTGRWSGA